MALETEGSSSNLKNSLTEVMSICFLFSRKIFLDYHCGEKEVDCFFTRT